MEQRGAGQVKLNISEDFRTFVATIENRQNPETIYISISSYSTLGVGGYKKLIKHMNELERIQVGGDILMDDENGILIVNIPENFEWDETRPKKYWLIEKYITTININKKFTIPLKKMVKEAENVALDMCVHLEKLKKDGFTFEGRKTITGSKRYL